MSESKYQPRKVLTAIIMSLIIDFVVAVAVVLISLAVMAKRNDTTSVFSQLTDYFMYHLVDFLVPTPISVLAGGLLPQVLLTRKKHGFLGFLCAVVSSLIFFLVNKDLFSSKTADFSLQNIIIGVVAAAIFGIVISILAINMKNIGYGIGDWINTIQYKLNYEKDKATGLQKTVVASFAVAFVAIIVGIILSNTVGYDYAKALFIAGTVFCGTGLYIMIFRLCK